MEIEMGVGVRNALAGLLSHYSNATSNNDEGAYKDTSEIVIAETILSIASKWVLDMKRRWNRATPIHRLPTEILLTIFQLSVPSDDFREHEIDALTECVFDTVETDYYARVVASCGVSSDWARLIRNTPAFWVYTSSTECQELTDLILERSRNSLLWVEYSSASMDDPDIAERQSEYVEAIRMVSHRCRTLVLRLHPSPPTLPSLPDLEELGTTPFPELSHLLISTPEGGSSPLPYFFKCGQPPLRFLEVLVSGTGLKWQHWPPFPELEVLRLGYFGGLGGQFTIKYSEIRDIVNTSPSLKSFELASVYITDLPRNATPALPSPSMPVLDRFDLDDVEPAQAIPLLLSHVALRSDAIVSIPISLGGRNRALKTEDLSRIIESLFRRVSSFIRPPCPPTLSITTFSGLDQASCSVSCYGEGLRIYFSARPGGVSWIGRLVQSLDPKLRNTLAKLHLKLESPPDWLAHSLNNRLSGVVELGISATDTIILEGLGGPSNAPTTEWLFPRVERLHLSLWGNHPDKDVAQTYPAMFTTLCKVAKARSIQNGIGGGNVVALERVELLGRGKVRKQDVEKLKALVPEVIIHQYHLEIIGESPSLDD